jgi:hypothetical protein
MSKKEVREIAAEYVRYGYRIEHTRHWKVYDGPRLVAVLPSSPCRSRADANARAQLRRVVRQRTEQGEAA